MTFGESSAHSHEWRTKLHADGCHWFTWEFACDCGATLTKWCERPLASGDWLDYGDFAKPDECQRCAELSEGAGPAEQSWITTPDGQRTPA